VPSAAAAARAQSAERVLDLLEHGHGVDERDPDGNTALHWASWHHMGDLVCALLERGAQPGARNSSGEAPLHWAAKASFVAGLSALSRGDRSLLSLRDCDGFTPFIISAQNDNAPVMEWMYMHGVSIEEQDDLGRTALHWACYKGHRRSVQWLLSRSASIAHSDEEGMTSMHWAALKGHEQVADMLLEVGAVRLLRLPDITGDTPISMAWAQNNHNLLLSFVKAACLQAVIGRPSIARNNLVDLFVCFVLVHIAVFVCVLAPPIWHQHAAAVACWSTLFGAAVGLWAWSCFSNPGWIRPRTIVPQTFSLAETAPSGSEQLTLEAGHAPLDPLGGDAEEDPLTHLELEQSKLCHQRQLMDSARGGLDAEGGGGASAEASARDAWRAQLDRAAEALRERARVICESVGRARTERLLAGGAEEGSEYLRLLEASEFKKVCVVCRVRRTPRMHHCRECGRCVDRSDHHCPWIDNCVGLGNHRSFFCFIFVLLAAIAALYYIIVLYVLEGVLPSLSSCSVECLAKSVTAQPLWPAMGGVAVLTLAVLDLVWLVFVGALVVRHAAYIAVDLTTYEVLVRPSHVQQRFPESDGSFWFFRGFGARSCLGNCVRFWRNESDGHDLQRELSEKQASECASPDPLRGATGHQEGIVGYRCFGTGQPLSPEPRKRRPLMSGPEHSAPCTPAKDRYMEPL